MVIWFVVVGYNKFFRLSIKDGFKVELLFVFDIKFDVFWLFLLILFIIFVLKLVRVFLILENYFKGFCLFDDMDGVWCLEWVGWFECRSLGVFNLGLLRICSLVGCCNEDLMLCILVEFVCIFLDLFVLFCSWE